MWRRSAPSSKPSPRAQAAAAGVGAPSAQLLRSCGGGGRFCSRCSLRCQASLEELAPPCSARLERSLFSARLECSLALGWLSMAWAQLELGKLACAARSGGAGGELPLGCAEAAAKGGCFLFAAPCEWHQNTQRGKGDKRSLGQGLLNQCGEERRAGRIALMAASAEGAGCKARELLRM